jgi:hypothetical protein
MKLLLLYVSMPLTIIQIIQNNSTTQTQVRLLELLPSGERHLGDSAAVGRLLWTFLAHHERNENHNILLSYRT